MSKHPTSNAPVYANFASEKLTIGAGVAIFHIASKRVVVCYHSRDRYWFLPKGRRNASEDTATAAQREGFEESGYRNRLLPLPIPHRQPPPDDIETPNPFVTEPLWTQLMPQSATAQYILFWYAAETLPEDAETALNVLHAPKASTSSPSAVSVPIEDLKLEEARRAYAIPPPYPDDLSIAQRVQMDARPDHQGKTSVYEPVRHQGTGVDEEELLYESYLLPIEEARRKLRGSIMADVVRRGWAAVELRMQMEEQMREDRGESG